MFKRREGFLPAKDNTQLFFQIWENPKAKGTIIISHGHGEHTESYDRLVNAFKDDSWTFCAMDLRGHGRSDGKRGFANDFTDYCEDYFTFVDKITKTKSTDASVLLSHSMGGLIQLNTLLDHPEINPTAQVCSSPLLGLSVPVPSWKNKASEVINQWLPKVTLWNEITSDMLTRDPDVIRGFEADVLRHDRMSPGVYLGFLNAIEKVQARAAEIKTPTLFQIATEDKVVSATAAKSFFENLGSTKKKIIEYGDGACHEIYNDITRENAFKDLKDYLDLVLGGKL
jgi:alpha-beta hydrolase superfamily lysophospholipase